MTTRRPAISWWRLITLLAAAVFLGRFVFAPDAVIASWMHGPTLVVHEAGHILFGPFGRFVMLLGGTLLQVALPLAFVIYFLLSKQLFSASLVLLWVSFALVDGSVYVADAQERALPLITFDRDTHDWWNLLRMMGLLERDNLIAALFHFQGFLALAAALALGVRTSVRSATAGAPPA